MSTHLSNYVRSALVGYVVRRSGMQAAELNPLSDSELLELAREIFTLNKETTYGNEEVRAASERH